MAAAAAATTAAPPTPAATIAISDHTPNPNQDLYDVTFNSTTITTTVTSDPTTVTAWLNTVTTTVATPQFPRIVGLDVEWRPNRHRSHDNPVATLQLCTTAATSAPPICLIFQIIHCQSPLPETLIEFMLDESNVFVGSGIEPDIERLVVDYGLAVGRKEELGRLARRREVVGLSSNSSSASIGLKELGRVVLGFNVDKPKSITMSRWDQGWLSYGQVQYACVDAYLSYEVGVRLNAGF